MIIALYKVSLTLSYIPYKFLGSSYGYSVVSDSPTKKNCGYTPQFKGFSSYYSLRHESFWIPHVFNVEVCVGHMRLDRAIFWVHGRTEVVIITS